MSEIISTNSTMQYGRLSVWWERIMSILSLSLPDHLSNPFFQFIYTSSAHSTYKNRIQICELFSRHKDGKLGHVVDFVEYIDSRLRGSDV